MSPIDFGLSACLVYSAGLISGVCLQKYILEPLRKRNRKSEE